MNISHRVTRLRSHSPEAIPKVTLRDRVALSDSVISAGRLLSNLAYMVSQRRNRPWLAMVAVPLLMNATMLMTLWWTWPGLIVCVWWWAERSWRYSWVAGVECAAIGTCWCMAGSSALALFNHSVLLVGAIWIATALVLAVESYLAR